MNPSSSTRCETENLSWMATGFDGVEHKPLAAESELDATRTSMLRLAPGARFPPPPEGFGIEAFVLEGSWVLEAGALRAGGYSRLPAGEGTSSWTATGCTLFLKLRRFAQPDSQVVHAQTSELPWSAGHGNLRVKPLHSFGSESTALVHWPAGEQFIPHRHWGGEEILVLSGTFEDEHGRYPKGTWLRSPHLSSHCPFVEEETVILVKTGHLLAASVRRP